MNGAAPGTNGLDTVQARSAAVQQFIEHHLGDADRLRHVWPKGYLPDFVSLHGLMLVLCGILMVLAAGLLARRHRPVPSGLVNLLEFFVQFVRDHIAVPFLGPEDGRRMTPFFCSVFFFILTANLLGLVPCFYTATANLSVTGSLACVSLGLMVLGAMAKRGVGGFIRGFVPHGVPWPVAVFLVPLEIAGLVVRCFALTVRLFANELAGHIVLFSMVGLMAIFGWAALPAILLAVMIYVLEVFVAFLQAYIFTLLSALFMGQTWHPAH